MAKRLPDHIGMTRRQWIRAKKRGVRRILAAFTSPPTTPEGNLFLGSAYLPDHVYEALVNAYQAAKRAYDGLKAEPH